MSKEKVLTIDNRQNLTVKILGRNIFTYFNHIIMQISRESFVCDCKHNEFIIKEMNEDVFKDMKTSEFGNLQARALKNKYPDKFCGLALYLEDDICGYICGLRPVSREAQYRIENCEFFVKYVFVYEKFRGKRVASKLFEELFKKTGENTLTLAVRKNNISAIKAYQRLGGKSICENKFLRVLKLNIPYYKV